MFEPGDYILCIDDINSVGWLTKGAIYTVKECIMFGVIIKELGKALWVSDRFIKIFTPLSLIEKLIYNLEIK